MQKETRLQRSRLQKALPQAATTGDAVPFLLHSLRSGRNVGYTQKHTHTQRHATGGHRGLSQAQRRENTAWRNASTCGVLRTRDPRRPGHTARAQTRTTATTKRNLCLRCIRCRDAFTSSSGHAPRGTKSTVRFATARGNRRSRSRSGHMRATGSTALPFQQSTRGTPGHEPLTTYVLITGSPVKR